MGRDFENEAEMSVFDKTHPALGPTEEAQDVDRLPRIIVPMPAFNDPNNPVALSGSVNLPLADHPVQHSEDYGQSVVEEVGEDEFENTMSAGARTLHEFDRSQDDPDGLRKAAGTAANADAPEDREEWQKKHWQAAAREAGLSTGGNMEALRARVEDHEAEQAEREEYEREVRSLSRDDLDKAAKKLDITPEEYSTKESLAEAVIAAEYGEDVPAGDKSSTDDQ